MADFARGQRLRALREGRHLSQEEAAHGIGVSVKTLREWEKGGKIRWPNAKKAGGYYEVDPESLVSREQGGTDELPSMLSSEDSERLRRVEQLLVEVLRHLRPSEPLGDVEEDDEASLPPVELPPDPGPEPDARDADEPPRRAAG